MDFYFTINKLGSAVSKRKIELSELKGIISKADERLLLSTDFVSATFKIDGNLHVVRRYKNGTS